MCHVPQLLLLPQHALLVVLYLGLVVGDLHHVDLRRSLVHRSLVEALHVLLCLRNFVTHHLRALLVAVVVLSNLTTDILTACLPYVGVTLFIAHRREADVVFWKEREQMR